MPETVQEQFAAMRAGTAQPLDAGTAEAADGAETKEQGEKVSQDNNQQVPSGEAGGSVGAERSDNSKSAKADKQSAAGDKSAADGAGTGTAEPNPLAEMKAELEAANARINALLALQTAAVPAKSEDTLPPLEDVVLVDLFTPEQVQAALDDEKEMAKLLQQVATKAASSGRESVLKLIPTIVKAETSKAVTIQTAVAEFFTNNKDLVPYRPIVASIINEIEVKNPGLTLDALLAQAETETRARMKLPKKATGKEVRAQATAQEEGKPAFAGTSSVRQQAPKVSAIQAQFLEMKKNRGFRR